MEKKMNSNSVKTRRVIAYIVLVFFAALCLFWFLLLFVNSTKTHGEVTNGHFSILPGSNLVKNFKAAINDSSAPIIKGITNSFIVSALNALLCTYFSTMTAFAIHAYNFKGKKAIFVFILAIMMIPTQVTALGFIKLMESMKLTGHLLPLILPAIASPVTFFYMKQYMESGMPLELLEAARIDGAGELRIFNTIALPLMKPAIAVQAIFSFVGSWNNYFTPALILKDAKDKWTLPVIIAFLRSADFKSFDMGKIYMTITLSILPVIVVYIFLSKHLVGGLAVGAVKG